MATFSSSNYDAKGYAEFRPQYNDRLRELIQGYHQGKHELALDVATGTGQVSRVISPYYKYVHASDISPVMVEHAVPIPNVSYSQGTGERLEEADGSVDLVISAQAAHWFDQPAFEAEVSRVLRPGGTVAILGYSWAFIIGHSRVRDVVEQLALGPLEPYWDEGRAILDGLYADWAFPALEDCERREWRGNETDGGFIGFRDMTMDSLKAYLGTWSAYENWKAKHPQGDEPDPIDALIDSLKVEGIKKDEKFRIGWNQVLIMARKPF
jgi:SAM-dependent methyltransferase